MAARREPDTTAPMDDFSWRRGAYGPAPRRGRSYLVIGIVLVLAGAAAIYVLRRGPAQPAGITVSVSGITETSAVVSWRTDQPLTSQAEYGTTSEYGSLSVFSGQPVTAHAVTLTGLTPGTTYHSAALSTNSAGQVTTSPDALFTTIGVRASADPTAGGTQSTVLADVTASDITMNSATIRWTTEQPLTSQVSYGITTGQGSLSAFGAAAVTSHSVKVTALAPGTTYYYSALSTNAAGHTGTSPALTFTTGSMAGSPVIGSVTANTITTTSATISWTTDQPSASQLKYGPTTDYGTLSAFGSQRVTTHSVTINGLTPGTTYNYAALSANATGQVGASANFTFTTVGGPPIFRQVAVIRTTATSATISWITDQPSTSQVKYAVRSTLRSLLHRSRGYDLASARDSSLVTFHSVTINGLRPDTTYNFAALSASSGEMENSSSELKFTTLSSKTQTGAVGPDSPFAQAMVPDGPTRPWNRY